MFFASFGGCGVERGQTFTPSIRPSTYLRNSMWWCALMRSSFTSSLSNRYAADRARDGSSRSVAVSRMKGPLRLAAARRRLFSMYFSRSAVLAAPPPLTEAGMPEDGLSPPSLPSLASARAPSALTFSMSPRGSGSFLSPSMVSLREPRHTAACGRWAQVQVGSLPGVSSCCVCLPPTLFLPL